MIKSRNEGGPVSIGFLLLPDFSMMAFSSSVEPLMMANRLAGQRFYECFVVGDSNCPVQSSSGFPVTPDLSFEMAMNLDAVFVCAGNQVHQQVDASLNRWLVAAASRKMVLGALGTGTYLLAKAGVLNDARCTIHWENLASLREEFPQLVISTALFERDNNRYTCAGGSAALDMFLSEIGGALGADMAGAVSEHCVCDRIRDNTERQRVPLVQQVGVRQPKLTEAVSLMEANIAEPISATELAVHVGLSRRQLERLFQQYLQCVPSRYYLELRLERARQLLLQTSIPVSEIAVTCGFSSAQHFSKCYRDTFGLPPRDERRKVAFRIDNTFNVNSAKSAAMLPTTLHRTTRRSASAPI